MLLSSIVLALDIDPYFTIINIIRCPSTLIGKAAFEALEVVESHKAVEKYKVHYCLATFPRCSLQTPPPSLLFSMLSSFSVLYIVGLASATCQLCTILESFL